MLSVTQTKPHETKFAKYFGILKGGEPMKGTLNTPTATQVFNLDSADERPYETSQLPISAEEVPEIMDFIKEIKAHLEENKENYKVFNKNKVPEVTVPVGDTKNGDKIVYFKLQDRNGVPEYTIKRFNSNKRAVNVPFTLQNFHEILVRGSKVNVEYRPNVNLSKGALRLSFKVVSIAHKPPKNSSGHANLPEEDLNGLLCSDSEPECDELE